MKSIKKTIFIAGHKGMVGSALTRILSKQDGNQIITRNRAELDLSDQSTVFEFLASNPIDEIYMAAAKVGGIHANQTYPAQFLYDNLVIQNNIIEGAHRANISKLLCLGSSCIYPRNAAQPMHETALMTGPLEQTNAPYAIAKIAGLKLCESYSRQYGHDYRSVMPTNLYGPFDNFHPDNAHVIPALMRRFHLAALENDDCVSVWGSGMALREFMHVDDMAAACLHVMNLPKTHHLQHTNPASPHINIGTGHEISINSLARMLAKITGFTGRIAFDASQPDGTPRKLLDVSRLAALGWKASTPLDLGLTQTYDWFKTQSVWRET